MWRDTALRLQVCGFDAWILVPVIVFFYHVSWRTLEIATGSIVLFAVLSKFGLHPGTFGRWLRGLFAGPVRPAVEIDRRRRLA